MQAGWVYILTNQRNGTLYIGVTSDLAARMAQHCSGAVPGFTSRYGLRQLVWFGYFENLHDARLRERQMKEWRRSWKIDLITQTNPGWRDLSDDLNC